jgi:ribonuclease HI
MINNEAEAYALYVGIKMVHSKRIKNLIICRDPMLVIRAIVQRKVVGSNIYNGYYVSFPRCT